jgi:hypothetical protein
MWKDGSMYCSRENGIVRGWGLVEQLFLPWPFRDARPGRRARECMLQVN